MIQNLPQSYPDPRLHYSKIIQPLEGCFGRTVYTVDILLPARQCKWVQFIAAHYWWTQFNHLLLSFLVVGGKFYFRIDRSGNRWFEAANSVLRFLKSEQFGAKKAEFRPYVEFKPLYFPATFFG